MAIKVQLARVTVYGELQRNFYDSLSGINLTQSSPVSADLTSMSASALGRVQAAINDGRLTFVSPATALPGSPSASGFATVPTVPVPFQDGLTG